MADDGSGVLKLVDDKWTIKLETPSGKSVGGAFGISSVDKDGKVKGAYALDSGDSGTFEGTFKDNMLTLKTSDKKTFTMAMTNWSPSKLGVGSWVDNNKPKEAYSLQVARKVELSAQPKPDKELLEGLKTFVVPIKDASGTLKLDVSKADAESGAFKGKLGKIDVEGKILGNMITFSEAESNKRFMILMTKQGKEWTSQTLVTPIPTAPVPKKSGPDRQALLDADRLDDVALSTLALDSELEAIRAQFNAGLAAPAQASKEPVKLQVATKKSVPAL